MTTATMAETDLPTDLPTAFTSLAPLNYTAFPRTSSSLTSLLTSTLPSIHNIISTIPSPLPLPGSLSSDSVHLPLVAPGDWKPLKSSPKDNPLGISVFKAPSTDGKGSWFARRSLHAGIPFERFREAVHPEFSLQGESEAGKPARGIGKDELVLRVSEVGEENAGGRGKAEIFRLSAQFPGPSAPRDFVEACLSAEAEVGGERWFVLISRPCTDVPGCEERRGFVRGWYESVEFIRKVRKKDTPVRASSVRRDREKVVGARRRANTVDGRRTEREDDAETVIDWIMVTRSDPGGTVPKWMVERGTPGGIIKDAEKFLNTVTASLETTEEVPPTPVAEGEEEVEKMPGGIELPAAGLQEVTPSDEPSFKDPTTSSSGGGLFSGALSSIAAGMAFLAQSAVPVSLRPATPSSSESDLTPSPSYSPSDMEEEDRVGNAETATISSNEGESQASTLPSRPLSPTPSSTSTSTPAASAEERALQDFLRRKEKLDEKYRREESRRTERERKAAEKHIKQMGKEERRYRRLLDKANEKRRKDEERREREAKKRAEKEDGARRKEIVELKRIVEALTKENVKLRERVEELEGALKQKVEVGKQGEGAEQ